MPVLNVVALALIITSAAAYWTHRIERKTGNGFSALAMGLMAIQSIREGDALWALFEAAFCAYFAREWWRGGGGDDTRRRLRTLAARFEGTRRTAPTTA